MNIIPINVSNNNTVRKYFNPNEVQQNYLSLTNSLAIFLSGLTPENSNLLMNSFGNKNGNIFLTESLMGNNSFVLFGEFTAIANIINQLIMNTDSDLLKKIRNTYYNYFDYNLLNFKIAEQSFFTNELTIMGILNVTPDSFSDGGKYFDTDKAITHAIEMIDNGADILDVGGESTRPGASAVSVDEELKRVIPVIEKIKKLRPNSIISIDTTKSQVAETALEFGAEIVNDISGLTFDDKMIEVIARYNATVIIMHIKGTPQDMQVNPNYDNVVEVVYQFLFNQTQKAFSSGISNVIIDPGIGFGKRLFDNYELLHNLDSFKGIGRPILVGLSRKSFIGKALNLEVGKRENASVIAETYAAQKGAAIIRTHDLKRAKELKTMLNFLSNPEIVVND